MDLLKYNRDAWDREVSNGNEWTIPVSPEKIAQARKGIWEVVLTPQKAVPQDWFGSPKGKKILALASAGGQQGLILAAAGAEVTVFDNSPKQLEQDRVVAEREKLNLKLIQGNMQDPWRLVILSKIKSVDK